MDSPLKDNRVKIELDISIEDYCDASSRRAVVARHLGTTPEDIAYLRVLRRSLDSRKGSIRYHFSAEVCLQSSGESPSPIPESQYKDCHNAPIVVIVGAGPAGLFAALRALELGLRPVIIDRGKPVEERKYDIAQLTRNGVVNPDSNWCFGEGGAGTYSDGKLYTRSTKRGDVGEVLRKFVEHGANPDICIDTHAHIGTDRLSGIIARMRQTIINHGGEYHFNSRMTDLCLDADGRVKGIVCCDGSRYEGVAVLLATGHSARDIYQLFSTRGWRLEAKPFAIGVRVEHPQSLINKIQYHAAYQSHSSALKLLPPAAYSLTTQVDGHGVFSFCMCPGGIIVPAATGSQQQVVNGMSNSHRNSAYANSGIAVTVSPKDVPQYAKHGTLALLRFQEAVEKRVWEAAGRSIDAPTQRLTDFCEGRTSKTLGGTNYMGQVTPAPLHELLPPFVTQCLRQGFRDFDRKMHGFYTREAHLLAVESRTSSPVRIPRSNDLQHPDLPRLYPCGEGAGYAGGIVSSAIDGMRCIEAIATQYV